MLNEIHHIFIVGIRGVAMANIARMLHQMGKHVGGSDLDATFITDSVLADSGISVVHSFEADSLPQEVDLVIYAASHGGKQNPQVVEAERRGIPILHQAEFLGILLTHFTTSLAVAGCHGKTTTSALLAFALQQLSDEVSYMIGVSEFNKLYGGNYSGSEYIVVEADEYGIDPPDNTKPKFHLLKPDYSIITNIDHDHPDVYETIEDTQKAFKTYALQSLQSDIVLRQLIICSDDKHANTLIAQLPKESYITYGTNRSADMRVSDITVSQTGTDFIISSKLFDINKHTVHSLLFGEKNALNSAAVIALLLHIGFEITEITKAISGFTGAKRRFELMGTSQGITLFDDYAHHPTEIIATIQAARGRFPKRRIVVLFQPHTYSRTHALADEFAQALALADYSIVLPVFASARESKNDYLISSEAIVANIKQKGASNAFAASSKDSALIHLEEIQQKGDIIFTMGAGDIYTLAPHILA